MDQNSRPVVDNIRRASLLLHPHTAQEQTSPSRVRPATPRAGGTNKGASSKVPSGPSSTTSGGPLFFARVPPPAAERPSPPPKGPCHWAEEARGSKTAP